MNEQISVLSNGFTLDNCRRKKEIGRNLGTNRVVGEWSRVSTHGGVSVRMTECFFEEDDR